MVSVVMVSVTLLLLCCVIMQSAFMLSVTYAQHRYVVWGCVVCDHAECCIF